METAKQSNFVSAVIYIYNNEASIPEALRLIHGELSRDFAKFEMICVNDSSTDASLERIRAFADGVDDCPVSAVNMGYFHGAEAAMEAGVDLSIGDFVFEFDSVPLDFDPPLIMAVFEKALSGYDIVGARPRRQSGGRSRLFYRLFNRFSGIGRLGTERFRVISRRAINRVDSISRAVFYRKALYASCGLKTASVPYANRTLPAPELTPRQRRVRQETALDSLVLFTDLAYKISLGLCILMICFTLGTGIYTAVVYFGQNRPVAGWAPLMGLISAGFLGVFGIQTILIKYLDLILNLVFKKQKYLIASVEKLR